MPGFIDDLIRFVTYFNRITDFFPKKDRSWRNLNHINLFE